VRGLLCSCGVIGIGAQHASTCARFWDAPASPPSEREPRDACEHWKRCGDCVSADTHFALQSEMERLLRRAAEAASLHEREALNLDSVAHSMTLAKSERFRARQKRDEHRAIAKALRALLDAPPPRRTGGGR
jgi:hypothetical protein